MREYTTPAIVDPPTTGGLADAVWDNAASHPSAAIFARRTPTGWLDVTAAEFKDQISAVAKGLIAAGVEHGDRVALLSPTRYEWTLADYAIWSIGAVTVPVYETSSASQIQWILTDSEAVAAIVEGPAHAAVVEAAREEAPALQEVWQIEDGAVEQLTVLGADVADAELDERRAAVTPGDMATLIYTSGTTGRPKGCKITHANFLSELQTAVKVLDDLFVLDGASTLLFLPLSHVFARIIQVGCVLMRVKIGHTSDVKNLVADLGAFKPTFILSVPRVFEKVFNSASQTAHSAGRGRIFDAAADTAIAYSKATAGAGRPGIGLRAKHAVFDRLVYAKLRAVLGGQVDYAVSGGAPLGDRLAHFFRGIGVPVLEGYGLTETTAALSVNLPAEMRIGTVGRPLPGVSVRVADDGELLFKGGQVMAGYWKNDEATAAAIEDGWFHTGDLGEIDDDGFVRITGRKKEILVTAGGKNIAPAVMEDIIRQHPLVSQCMVVGDGKPFVAALVTIDTETIGAWAGQRGKSDKVEDLVDDEDLIAEVQKAVDEANDAVSKAESIRKFTILPNDWTQDSGELSLKLSLRRHVVVENHAADIEALYTK